MTSSLILIAFGGLLGGLVAGYIISKKRIEARNKEVYERTERMIEEAKAKSKEILMEAKNEAFKLEDEAKKEERRKREQLEKIEERLVKKEEIVDQRSEQMDKMKADLETKVASVRELREEVEKIYRLQADQLEKMSQMTKEEAREILLKKVEEETKDILVAQIKKAEEELKKEAKERAKFIIADAIQKYAAEATTESTSTVVNLPSDEMKGRIIGREGRNINTFEEITGVDVIVDDTPGSILISGFDLIRRYIAKVALERLIADGRIHPARIEETVEKVKEEVNMLVKELGEKACYEAGVTGLPPNLVKLLGRLKFRVSHGQNVLKHSMEVSVLAASLASEIGADIAVCRKAGLLHDIGRAVDHEIQGHHAQIGADIARKFTLPQEVIQAIETHDGDPEPQTVEARLVEAANLISNARPGANKENLNSYIRRLEELEHLCKSFDGVLKAFAVQAGSEVRVFVKPEEVDDLGAAKLSHSIARKIEKDYHTTSPVKVAVIREIRAEGLAK